MAFLADTAGVRVEAEPSFLRAQSNLKEGRFVWSYTVTIANLGAEAVQLLTRFWKITDAAGLVQEVHGAGVVGQQPVLQPGESFTYTSAAPLTAPSGLMSGSYGFKRLSDGTLFDVAIPTFPLDSPFGGQRAN